MLDFLKHRVRLGCAGNCRPTSGPPGIPASSRSWHKISLLKQAAHIAVDGEVKRDWFDEGSSCGPVLKGGKFGLRQMVWAAAEYRNLTISDIKAN